MQTDTACLKQYKIITATEHLKIFPNQTIRTNEHIVYIALKIIIIIIIIIARNKVS